MAESIADAVGRSGETRTVVHFSGAFHTDYGGGATERTRRRLGDRQMTLVTILPVADIDAVAPAGNDLKQADFLVYTLK